MADDLSTIASIADAALSFALLAGIVLMFIRGTLVSKTAHDEVVQDYEDRLVTRDKQCELRVTDRDSRITELRELYDKYLNIVREEGNQRVNSLTEIMREREKRYAAVIASLEVSANLESDIATIIRMFKTGETVAKNE